MLFRSETSGNRLNTAIVITELTSEDRKTVLGDTDIPPFPICILQANPLILQPALGSLMLHCVKLDSTTPRVTMQICVRAGLTSQASKVPIRADEIKYSNRELAYNCLFS